MDDKKLDSKEILIRRKVAEIVPLAIRRQHPFDKIDYEGSLNRYWPYLKRLDENKKEEVINALIANVRYEMGADQILDEKAFTIKNEFDEKIIRDKLKGEYVPPKLFPQEKGIKPKNLILDVMKQRYQNYIYNSSVVSPPLKGAFPFSTPFLKDNKLLIVWLADKVHIEVMIGIAKPLYLVDICSFFSAASDWYFSSSTDCQIVINKALKIIDALLPIFTEKIKEAVKQNS